MDKEKLYKPLKGVFDEIDGTFKLGVERRLIKNLVKEAFVIGQQVQLAERERAIKEDQIIN